MDAVRERELYFWTLEEKNLALLLHVYPEGTPVSRNLDFNVIWSLLGMETFQWDNIGKNTTIIGISIPFPQKIWKQTFLWIFSECYLLIHQQFGSCNSYSQIKHSRMARIRQFQQYKSIPNQPPKLTEFDDTMKTLIIQHGLFLTEIFHDVDCKPQLCIHIYMIGLKSQGKV